jgi:hypothetical protein
LLVRGFKRFVMINSELPPHRLPKAVIPDTVRPPDAGVPMPR